METSTTRKISSEIIDPKVIERIFSDNQKKLGHKVLTETIDENSVTIRIFDK